MKGRWDFRPDDRAEERQVRDQEATKTMEAAPASVSAGAAGQQPPDWVALRVTTDERRRMFELQRRLLARLEKWVDLQKEVCNRKVEP